MVGLENVDVIDSLHQAYRGRTILLTGHNGFKGSWMTFWFHQLGATVVGISLAPEPDSLFQRALLSDMVIGLEIDIRDGYHGISEAIAEHPPDLVVHMAAQPLVLDSYADPYSTFQTNVMGTVNLLEAMRQLKVRIPAIVITTDKVYKPSVDRSHRETDPLGGTDPYSLSKAATELAVAAWRSLREEDRFRLATTRAGNVIGGGDAACNRLLPDLIRAFYVEEPASIRNPESVRPWQHVLDPIFGYLLLGRKMLEGAQVPEAINFGPESRSPLSVAAVADIAVQSWGGGARWTAEETLEARHHESTFLALDSSLAQASLGWTPTWGATEAVQRTISWWRSVLGGGDPRQAMARDLKDFTESQASER